MDNDTYTMALIERLRCYTVGDYHPFVCSAAADEIERLAEAANEIERLRDALTKLSNEVMGSLPLMEPIARQAIGSSNYAILIQRAEEARALTSGEPCR